MVNGFDWLDRKIFGSTSPVPLAVFRMLAAGAAFLSLLIGIADFDAWFTEQGFIPVSSAARWSGPLGRIDFLDGVRDERVTACVYAITMLAALLTAAGLFTRVASLTAFFGLVSIHHRAADILHSGDTLLRIWLFVLLISPCAEALSFDRWRRRRETAPPARISIWPQRMVQFQLAVVYLTTVWSKLRGTDWGNGTAIWYVMNLSEYRRFPLPEFLGDPPFVAILTYGTLVTEAALATVVFVRPLRKWVLIAGVMLHLGIEYAMNIPLFALTICSGYVCFYPAVPPTRTSARK